MKKILSLILVLSTVLTMSVFAVSAESANVAKIGATEYATLADAIKDVAAGDVVIDLIDDASMDYNAREAYGTEETTSLTINGNGYTLTLNQINSDWSSVGLKNTDAKLVLNNMTIEKTGHGDTSGAWNKHAINFKCEVEMNDVVVNNSVAVTDGATLNNVIINEANGYYGLWINAYEQTVTLDGCEINATNGGRGIKVADQYIDAPAKIELNVSNTVFNTARKAAVLVSSSAGASITVENCDISNVAEDQTAFAWVDEDWSAYANEVEIDGASKTIEGVAIYAVSVTTEGGSAYTEELAYAEGEEVEVIVNNVGRYIFKSIEVYANGELISTDTTFTMPACAVEVIVTFEKVMPSIVKYSFNASVALEGAKLEKGDFMFQLSYLYNGEEVVIQTLKNAANGELNFAPIHSSTPYNYTFFIKQIALDDAGVEYDATVYEISVKVAYGKDGKLAATISQNNVEFVNSIK